MCVQQREREKMVQRQSALCHWMNAFCCWNWRIVHFIQKTLSIKCLKWFSGSTVCVFVCIAPGKYFSNSSWLCECRLAKNERGRQREFNRDSKCWLTSQHKRSYHSLEMDGINMKMWQKFHSSWIYTLDGVFEWMSEQTPSTREPKRGTANHRLTNI